MLLNPPSVTTISALNVWASTLIPIIGFLILGVQKYISDKKQKITAKLDAVIKTTTATHVIVNGSKALTLMLIADQADELAKLKNTPEAVEHARISRLTYDTHMRAIAESLAAESDAKAVAEHKLLKG